MTTTEQFSSHGDIPDLCYSVVQVVYSLSIGPFPPFVLFPSLKIAPS